MANAARPVAVPASSGSANQASRYAEMMAALNASPISGGGTSKTAKKYAGYASQAQMEAAIKGAGLSNRDAAFQQAAMLATEADKVGLPIANQAAQAKEEARQAWQAEQKRYLQANNARGARAAEGFDQAMNDQYLSGFNPDDARRLSEMSRGDQASASRYSAMAGGPALPVIEPLNPGGQGADARLIEATTSLANARNPVAASVVNGDGGMVGDAAREFARQQYEASRLGEPVAKNPDVGNIAEYSDQLQSAVDTGLAAPREDRAVARDLEATPLSQYTQRAAVGQFGLDPYLAMGKFGENLDVADFRTGRDAQSIAETGMTYSEAQAYAKQVAADQARAAGDEQKAADLENSSMEDQIASVVSQQTGMDANALSQVANVDIATLGSIVADPSFNEANAKLATYVSTGDIEALQQALADVATIDPELGRIFMGIYEPYIPSSYNPIDEGTWSTGG